MKPAAESPTSRDPVGRPVPARSSSDARPGTETSNEAWGAFSRMVAGMIIYGALGWWLGGVFDRTTLGLAVGLLLGLGLGLYLSLVSLRRLGEATPRLQVSSSVSWSARMTRARIERAREEPSVG